MKTITNITPKTTQPTDNQSVTGKTTTKRLNDYLSQYDLEIVKGKGYFYFNSTNIEGPYLRLSDEIGSLFILSLNQYNHSEWIEILKNKINECLEKITITITVSYNYNGELIESINTTNKQECIELFTETGIEEIEQYIRELILDECLGWEKALAKEHKVFKHFEKNYKVRIEK